MRVLADFEEMPGLIVTTSQAARFWELETSLAEISLCQLKRRGYLREARGRYRLAAAG